MAEIQMLRFDDPKFEETLARIVNRGETAQAEVIDTVRGIIEAVRHHGDQAVIELTEKFDHLALTPETMEVSEQEMEEAYKKVSDHDVECLELAAERVFAFHEKQKTETWISTEEEDVLVGSKVTPMERVGLYVPGGKAAYPSSVVMCACPAQVAGVEEIVMAVPMPRGEVNPHVLVAADICGVDRIFKMGGAQAIAAMAYGTKTVPRVDKIVGPGNIYVAIAKGQVFGQVDIDMIAGPSEILIINDGSGNPAHLAADLMSQAEHDEMASAVLVTTSQKMAEKVLAELGKQLPERPRKEIIAKALKNYSAIIVAQDMDEAVTFSNRIAPEHLELAVDNPFELLPQIKHAGAIFMGHYTPEAMGDYLAGPNHTLPTGGTARFHSPLCVDDYVKHSSIINISRKGLERLGEDVVHLATLEGLEAHARTVALRLGEKAKK
jgi:histidinol dehydrogenase